MTLIVKKYFYNTRCEQSKSNIVEIYDKTITFDVGQLQDTVLKRNFTETQIPEMCDNHHILITGIES